MKPSTPRRGRRATPDDDPRGREVAFVLSCVDQPRPGERVQAGAILSGKGWAISESPIASIAVHLGEAFLCYANYGQPRPEIGRDFGHYPQAHHAGFIFSVRLGDALEQERSTDLQFRLRARSSMMRPAGLGRSVSYLRNAASMAPVGCCCAAGRSAGRGSIRWRCFSTTPDCTPLNWAWRGRRSRSVILPIRVRHCPDFVWCRRWIGLLRRATVCG
jgi:hypothetical protein